jgi:hypothetical protein
MPRPKNVKEAGNENNEREDFRNSDAVLESSGEFSSIVVRLDQIDEQRRRLELDISQADELTAHRLRIVQQIVEARAPGIKDAVAKVTILSSLLCDGELQLGLTQQCLADCDLALAVDGEPEQSLTGLEPDLWNACQRVRTAMQEGRADPEALCVIWWREFTTALRAISRYEATTRIGLKAKGAIFHEVLRFASATEGLEALQISYMRDFRSLAYARMNGSLSVPRPVMS